MSLFFAMGDSCRSCSQSNDPEAKATHKNNLYMQSTDVLREAVDSCDMNVISYDDYLEVCNNVKRLRLMCTECDKKEALVHNFVSTEISALISKELKEADENNKRTREEVLAGLGVKKEGNIYHTDFSKGIKKIEGRGD